MCSTPNCVSARPTCVGCLRSTGPPASAAYKNSGCRDPYMTRAPDRACRILQVMLETSSRYLPRPNQKRRVESRSSRRPSSRSGPSSIEALRAIRAEAVLVQHHPRQRTPRPLAPVRTPLRRLLQQPLSIAGTSSSRCSPSGTGVTRKWLLRCQDRQPGSNTSRTLL